MLWLYWLWRVLCRTNPRKLDNSFTKVEIPNFMSSLNHIERIGEKQAF